MGSALSKCPRTGDTAKVGSLVVLTGYVVVGLGGISLAAAALPYLHKQPETALLIAFGVIIIALGVGFSQAAHTLQKIVARANIEISELPSAPVAQ
jgi:hypothetical protein